MSAPRTPGRPRRRAGRGTLLLIGGLLLGSAGIRVGGETGKAIARVTETDPAPMMQAEERMSCPPAPDIAVLLQALNERESAVESREEEVRARMKALAVADEEIARKMTRLVAAEDSLKATMALADSAAEDDLAKLTEVYENMKPKNAAELFETMEPAFAAGFLGRMRPEAAAGIMAGLSPTAAYTISVVLAGRNSEVPAE